MTKEDLRRLALALPGAEEKSHFDKADFRVRNKIFASLKDDATGVIKLLPEQQAMMAEPSHGYFSQFRVAGAARAGQKSFSLRPTRSRSKVRYKPHGEMSRPKP